MSNPIRNLFVQQTDNEPVHKGVLRAIANLPDGLRELLQVDSADVLPRGTVTDDDEGMTFMVDDHVSLELRPFARAVTLIAHNGVGGRCTVSYNGGFKEQDIERLLGFYHLAKRGGLTETAGTWSDKLDQRLVATPA